MRTGSIVAFVLVLSVVLCGCDNPCLPAQAKIQVNVPDEPHPGTRTKVIASDVQEGREAFLRLFNTTQRVGMCNPGEIENSRGACEVMSVSYWGQAVEERVTFYILKNQQGQWITTGFGGVEVYDHPKGFPEYRYTADSVAAVKTWYEAHVPESDRKR